MAEARARPDGRTSDEKLAQALTDIAVIEERLRNRDEALELQANEYERRLGDLNHAHAEARAKEAEFLPKATYDKSEKELLEWRRGVDAVISTLSARRDTNIAYFGAVISILSVVLWAADILIRR